MAGIKDYSPVPASNTALFPEGMAPSAVNDGMRQVQADIRAEVASKGADIASAETVELGAATGDFVDVTGTTTIISFGTVSAGIRRTVRFRGALTLTHNAASLILPGGADITTADGDIARFRSLGAGSWVCEGYSRASGQPIDQVATASIADEAVTAAKIAKAVRLPPGMVAPFAMSVAPTGWLKANGAAVARATYADLDNEIYVGDDDNATADWGYRCTDPDNKATTRATDGSYIVLPDLRGEFVRGWADDGSVDSARTFGSSQLDALQNITGSVTGIKPTGSENAATGAFETTGTSAGSGDSGTTGARGFDFDASRVARTSTETRPRNIALMYCIKT